MAKEIKQAISRRQSKRESQALSTVIKSFVNHNMSTESSELDFSITLTSQPPKKHHQKQVSENNNIDVMCAKIGQQQADNLYVFMQNLANHLNMFLNRLEEANKNKLTPVVELETANRHAPRSSSIM